MTDTTRKITFCDSEQGAIRIPLDQTPAIRKALRAKIKANSYPIRVSGKNHVVIHGFADMKPQRQTNFLGFAETLADTAWADSKFDRKAAAKPQRKAKAPTKAKAQPKRKALPDGDRSDALRAVLAGQASMLRQLADQTESIIAAL